jgi:hypothetical protein
MCRGFASLVHLHLQFYERAAEDSCNTHLGGLPPPEDEIFEDMRHPASQTAQVLVATLCAFVLGLYTVKFLGWWM